MKLQWLSIFLWVCFYSTVPLIYLISRNDWKPKKNIILGVTLPREAQDSDAVRETCLRYRKELRLVFWLLTVLSLPPLVIRWFSVSLTWLLTWLTAAVVLLQLPYIRGWKRMREIKRQSVGEELRPQKLFVDLDAIREEEKTPLWNYLLPVAADAVLCAAVVYGKRGTESVLLWAFTCGTLFLSVALMSFLGWRGERFQRTETVNRETELTLALTEVRRRCWRKVMLEASWLTVAMTAATVFLTDHTVWFLIAVAGCTVRLLWLGLRTELEVRRAQERLTAGAGNGEYADEDRYWLWGCLYYNPHDRHTLKNDRVGMNMMANLATPLGKGLMVFAAAVLLAMPFMGAWCMVEEFTPVKIVAEEEGISARHTGEKYAVAYSEVESAEVITELPGFYKDIGSAMERVCKGQFRVDGYGVCRLCLDPQAEQFLVIRTAERTYIFSPDAETLAEILSRLTDADAERGKTEGLGAFRRAPEGFRRGEEGNSRTEGMILLYKTGSV